MSDPVTPLTPAQAAIEEGQAAHEGYLHREAVAADIFVNESAGGLPDETISSHAARASREGKWWGKAMSSFLNIFQHDHGADAQAGDVERAQAVIDAEVKSGDIPK